MIIFGVIFGYDSEVDVFDNEDYREVCPYDSASHDELYDDGFYTEDECPEKYFDWDYHFG